MISSVFVSGRLGKRVGRYRYVEVDRAVPSPDGRYETDRFLVRSPLGEDSSFMKLPLGSYICFKGRLEKDEERGIVIVDELDETFGARPQSGEK
ncbi:MAG: hypothetical protein LKK13_02695 [Bacilli bacterium]|jgi:hypothetical protein|nr:hypothetical protein [Bacilli bacterium]